MTNISRLPKQFAIDVDQRFNSIQVGGLAYPSRDGAPGQVMVTDGAGSTSFTSIPNLALEVPVTGNYYFYDGVEGMQKQKLAIGDRMEVVGPLNDKLDPSPFCLAVHSCNEAGAVSELSMFFTVLEAQPDKAFYTILYTDFPSGSPPAIGEHRNYYDITNFKGSVAPNTPWLGGPTVLTPITAIDNLTNPSVKVTLELKYPDLLYIFVNEQLMEMKPMWNGVKCPGLAFVGCNWLDGQPGPFLCSGTVYARQPDIEDVDGLWRDSVGGTTQIITDGTAGTGSYSNGSFVPTSPLRPNYTVAKTGSGLWTFTFPNLSPTTYTATVTESSITFSAPATFTFTRLI
jgi:hypothetical protein